MCPCHAVAGYLSFDSSSTPPDRQGLGSPISPSAVGKLFTKSFLERAVERVVEDVTE